MRKFLLLAILLGGALPAYAAISGAHLTSGGSTAGTNSYVTSSVTPTANNVVFFSTSAHLSTGNGPGPVSSVAGDGLTWQVVFTLDAGLSVGSGLNNRLEVWCGVGASPTGGSLTVTWGTLPTTTSWSVDQTSGGAQTCSSVVGSTPSKTPANSATASPITTTLTFDVGTSGTYAACFTDATETINAGSGMTDLGGNNTNSNSIETEYAAGEVTTVTCTYGGAAVRWGIIALEIKVPVVPAANERRRTIVE